MNVSEIVYRVLGDDSQFNSTMSNVGKTASKALSAISKAALAVTGAAATAVGALAKSAIDGYAEYEQLVGGVETLFKDSADVIQNYADNAYKTAGMSANAYMETVTGFSASLLQSLDNDTAKAAEKGNQAVIDMADNANKMGTDIQSIQNAYQGFAKQNFTMLDNLKLGYGGTKQEMERLLEKAEELQKVKGIDVSYSIDSFADIVDAIHVVQTEMGITGTTAKEASTTIQGSISSMKGAWENLMVGLADPTQDFDRLVSNLVDSVITVSENLMPRIMAVLPQMATGITELAGELLPLIPETLEKMLPGVLEGANNLISALLDTLSSIVDTAIPIITENADEIIDTLLTGLVEAVPQLVSKAADLCTALISAILDNADILTQGAVDIVVSLAEGISQNADILIDSAVEAVFVISDTLIDNIDVIIEAGSDLIEALGTTLIEHIPDIILKTPEIVIGIAGGIIGSSHEIVSAAEAIIQKLGDTLVNYDWSTEMGTVARNIDEALSNAVAGGVAALMEATGTDIIDRTITDYSDMTKESIDKWISTSEAKLDELDRVWGNLDANGNVANVPEWIRRGADESNQSLASFIAEQRAGTEDLINSLRASYEAAETEAEKHERKMEEIRNNGQGISFAYSDEAAKLAEEEAKKHFKEFSDTADDEVESLLLTGDELKEAITKIDNAYDLGNYDSEKAYWADRLTLLEANRNEEDQAWIKYYSQTKEHYEKAVENEAKEAQKAVKEQETALKNELEDKFRELETEQLKKEYDDSWLIEQKRAYIETLDHNTDLYKDNDLKLLKEQKSYNDKALKETETAAKKQQDALEKSFDSIVKSRDSLADKIALGGDIFKTSEETDKRTGAKGKSRDIDIAGFERKIEAKKKLTSKIAELMEKNTPDDIISELLKMDPEDALAYANDLLRSPDKLSRLSKGFEKDEAYSKIIANMVTENSDEFKSLGEEAGTVFGEGFMSAFRENWEGAFQTVFGDEEYKAQATVQVKAANSSAAETTAVRRDYSVSDNSNAGKTARTSGTASQGTYKIVDLNGRYIAAVVNAENARTAKTGGG